MKITNRPIRPEEIVQVKEFPPFVYLAFNTLVAKHWSGKQAVVKQDEVVNLIVELAPEGTTRHQVFEEKWLDIEEVYGEAGFEVEYDKPGYSEDYEATFTFTKKKGS